MNQSAGFSDYHGVGMNPAANEWVRLHTLARDALHARLTELPVAEQADVHTRAMRWLEERGMLEEAARHALAAGNREVAFDLAEQSLYEAALQGQVGMVLDWVELLPETELDKRPRLRLAAAWVLALSERHDAAERLVAGILEGADVDLGLRPAAPAPSRDAAVPRHPEHGAHAEGARSARTPRAQPLQQGGRPGDGRWRGNREVAPQEPVRQAGCSQQEARGAAGSVVRVAGRRGVVPRG